MSHSIISTLTALLLTATAVQAIPQAYIVGGQSHTAASDFPYFVEMIGCGGALITPDAVLFAAHCGNVIGNQVIISSFHSHTLEGNGNGAHVRFCEDWVQHSKWDVNTGINWDFALCKLDSPVENLADGAILEWENTPSLNQGDDLIVMGYGYLTEGGYGPEYLNSVVVPYIPNNRCREPGMYGGGITDQMLCAGFMAGGKDACQGDSGGPIVKRVGNVDHHVGVVSFGQGCARASKPGVYARTSEAVPWIRETLCSNRFNSVWCDDYSPSPPVVCNEAQLDVLLLTDGYGKENSWRLTVQDSDELITKRQYTANNFGNSHSICLNQMECYTFNMTDYFGDGMCSDPNCGFYELRIPGEEPFFQGGSFEFSQLTRFCIDNNGNKVDVLPDVPQGDNNNNSNNNNNNGGGGGRRKNKKNGKKGKGGKNGRRRDRQRDLHVETGDGETETRERVLRVRTREILE